MVSISSQEVVYKAVDRFANKMISEFIESIESNKEYDTIISESLKTSLISMDESKVVLKLEFDSIPSVDLPDYKKFKLNIPSTEVDDREVESEFNKIIQRDRMLVPKEDQATVENGDSVNFDFVGKKDGVAFEGGSAKEYEMIIGSGQFIPGFEEQMIGMKIGEEKVINVSFPSDYHAKELAGAPVTFDVKINSIALLQNPEFDEDYFKKFNIANVKSDVDMKNYLRNQLVS
jgi:trigger factor